MSKISVITPVRARSPAEVQWLIEAVDSVVAQTYGNWEMVICNDHSEVDMSKLRDHLSQLSDGRIRGCKTEGKGVCDARNTAARNARGNLLLPLDADDLLPPGSMKLMMDAWDSEGIVYGDTLLFGQDFQKVYKSKPYSFELLLRSLIMPVGSLHLKSDWEKIGGWSNKMEHGLEDWEYWIRMGKNGVCGNHISDITYKYRRRMGGRYMSLRGSNRYNEAYQRMRSLHSDVYNGRYPVGCCGGRPLNRRRAAPNPALMDANDDDVVRVRYTGKRSGSFRLVGQSTGVSYLVPGKNKLVVNVENNRLVVYSHDARRLVVINHGRDFEIV